ASPARPSSASRWVGPSLVLITRRNFRHCTIPSMGTLPLDLRSPRPAPPQRKALTAGVDEFTLHADTAVAAHDPAGRERLARYGAPPPRSGSAAQRWCAGSPPGARR